MRQALACLGLPELVHGGDTNQYTHPVRTDNAPWVRSTASPGQGREVEPNPVWGLGAPALLTGRRARDFSDIYVVPVRQTHEVRLSTLVNAGILRTGEKRSARAPKAGDALNLDLASSLLRRGIRHYAAAVVERERRLPDLAAQLRGRRRRRYRRPRRDHLAARLPRGLGGRRAMAFANLPVAAGRRRLRHQRLQGHRPYFRLAGAFRRAAGGRPRARDEARNGSRRQPHLRRTPVVRRVAVLLGQPQARLVLVAAPTRWRERRRSGRR